MVSLSGLRYIYEARLATRSVRLQEIFAVVGIAVGVALFFASQVSSTSLDRGVPQLNAQLAGNAQVQMQARSYQGVPETVLAQVRRVPGVQSALPLLERQVNLIGPDGERAALLVGVEPKAMRFASRFDRQFTTKQLNHFQAIALPEPLNQQIERDKLETVRIQLGSSFTAAWVGTTLSASEIGALVHSPVAVSTLAYAQRLANAPSTVTRILIHYDPALAKTARAGLARIARAWDINLTSSALESKLFAVAVAPENQSEKLFSAISALVGVLFAINAMLVTAPSRRKLLEDLLPHGYTRLMIVQILMVNALALGVIACIIGLVLGDALSILVFDVTPGYLTFAFPIGGGRVIEWQTVALAVALALGTAAIGVFAPLPEVFFGLSQRTRRLRVGWWRPALAIVGVLSLAVTTYTLLLDTRAALVGNITLVLALACALPFAFSASVWLFSRLSDLLDDVGSGYAAAELDSPPARVRYLAIAATAALAVFATAEFGGTQSNLIRGLDASIRGMDGSANLWVVPSGGSSLQTTVAFAAINPRTLDVPGVQSVSAYGGSFLNWGDHRVWVIAPGQSVTQPIPPTQVLTGSLKVASAKVRSGSWAVLSQGLADEQHIRLGERFTLPAPRPITLRLAATTTNLGWPPGTVILSAGDYAEGWRSDDPSAYQIKTTASPGRERALLRAALGNAGVSVQTAGEREALHFAAARQGLSRLTQIRILIYVAAIAAVLAALTAMIYARRDQIAQANVHGISSGKLWRSLMWENAVVLVCGSALGVIFGVYAQLLGSHYLAAVTGFPIIYSVELFAAIVSFGLVALLTVVVLGIPGLRVVRAPASAASQAP
jgi:putative ABC transport system permease protein